MFFICVVFYSEAFQNTKTNDGDQGLIWSKVFLLFLDKNRVFVFKIIQIIDFLKNVMSHGDLLCRKKHYISGQAPKSLYTLFMICNI